MGLVLQTRGVERYLSPLLGVELSELLSGALCFLRTSFFLSTLDHFVYSLESLLIVGAVNSSQSFPFHAGVQLWAAEH